MRLEVLTEFPVGPAWAGQWNALALRSGIDDVFVTYDWVRAAAEFDEQCRPLIVCAYTSPAGTSPERLVGIAPLALRRCRVAGWSQTVLELIAGPWADYNDVIVEPAFQAEFMARLAGFMADLIERGECSHVRFNNLPADSSTLAQLSEQACRAGLQAIRRVRDVGPVLELDAPDQAGLDSLLDKKGVGRKARILAKKGRVEFRIVRASDEMRQCLTALYRFHTARYLLNGQRSVFDPEDKNSLCRLLDLLLTRLSPGGGVCLPTLFLDDQPIAMSLMFESCGVMELYAMTFDAGIVGTSPGEILVLETARYCRQAGLKRFDFGAGDEAYKARFTNARRTLSELILHRGSVTLPVRAALANGKDRIKVHPVWGQLFHWLKELAQLLQLEAHRVGRVRAIGSWLAHRCRERFLAGRSSEPEVLPTTMRLIEWRSREISETVLKYRRDLPAWEFARGYELLRQGQPCYLLLKDNRLLGILNHRPADLRQAAGILSETAELIPPQHNPGENLPAALTRRA